VLKDENMEFFENFMVISKFRKCIYGEYFEGHNEEKKVSMIYSGKIGSCISNLKEYFKWDNINELDVGEEFG